MQTEALGAGTTRLRIRATIIVKTRHNGQNIILSLPEEEVENLFYKIAHAGGRLKQMSSS